MSGVYVSGFSDFVDKQLLYETFLPFGEIVDVEIPKDAMKNRKGYAFITFKEEDDAVQAVLNMNKSELLGKVLTVNMRKNTKKE